MSKKNVDIVDIMKRCISHQVYPVVFEDDCGLDCQLEHSTSSCSKQLSNLSMASPHTKRKTIY